MSTRRKIALTALVWLAAAGLAVLPNVWPWYLHRLTYFDEPMWFASGWLWCGILTRRGMEK